MASTPLHKAIAKRLSALEEFVEQYRESVTAEKRAISIIDIHRIDAVSLVFESALQSFRNLTTDRAAWKKTSEKAKKDAKLKFKRKLRQECGQEVSEQESIINAFLSAQLSDADIEALLSADLPNSPTRRMLYVLEPLLEEDDSHPDWYTHAKHAWDVILSALANPAVQNEYRNYIAAKRSKELLEEMTKQVYEIATDVKHIAKLTEKVRHAFQKLQSLQESETENPIEDLKELHKLAKNAVAMKKLFPIWKKTLYKKTIKAREYLLRQHDVLLQRNDLTRLLLCPSIQTYRDLYGKENRLEFEMVCRNITLQELLIMSSSDNEDSELPDKLKRFLKLFLKRFLKYHSTSTTMLSQME